MLKVTPVLMVGMRWPEDIIANYDRYQGDET